MTCCFCDLAALGCLCLYDCPRRWILRKSKRACGAGVFIRRRKLPAIAEDEDDSLYSMPLAKPPRRPATILLIFNAVTAVVGAASFAMFVYFAHDVMVRALTTPFLALTLYIFLVSVLGMVASFKRAHGVSVLLLTYFYLAILACLLLLWGCIWAFGFNETVRLYVDKNWHVMSSLLSCCYDASDSYELQVTAAASALNKWLIYCGLGGMFVIAMFLASLCAAAWVAKPRVLLSTSYFVFNNFFLVAGALVFIGSIVLLADDDPASTVAQVSLAFGLFTIAVTILGLVTVNKKMPHLMLLHSALTCVLAVAAIIAAVMSFRSVASAASIVDEVSAASLHVRAVTFLFTFQHKVLQFVS